MRNAELLVDHDDLAPGDRGAVDKQVDGLSAMRLTVRIEPCRSSSVSPTVMRVTGRSQPSVRRARRETPEISEAAR